jgi:hypothetical protein
LHRHAQVSRAVDAFADDNADEQCLIQAGWQPDKDGHKSTACCQFEQAAAQYGAGRDGLGDNLNEPSQRQHATLCAGCALFVLKAVAS